ncbi:alpha/beta hydrolase [Caulobacter sp. CCNWLY153]|nr:alpha/beta hydrolase [Caulobacter radicis]
MPKFLRVLKWTAIVLVGLAVAGTLTVLAVANSQDGSVKVLQSYLYGKWKREPNAFEPLEPPRDRVRADGVRLKTNFKYDQTYPNSFMDIWYGSADTKVKRPTVIFLHGGGWFMGSKDMGDPMAAGGPNGEDLPFGFIARHGFNLVNLDYALAPAYRYPVPLEQLNNAIKYMQDHQDELGLDMSRVIIMGGSAGAQMTAQYGALLADPAYAAEVGVKPSIDPAHVKGLVIFSAPLKFSGFKWRMNAMLWAYLGTKDLETSKQARQVDILSHVTPNYPATYITDGNQADTFPEHAKAMAKALRQNGVDYVFNYYEPSEALLDHGYSARLNTKQGRDNMEKAVAFMQQRTGVATTPAAPAGAVGGAGGSAPAPRL